MASSSHRHGSSSTHALLLTLLTLQAASSVSALDWDPKLAARNSTRLLAKRMEKGAPRKARLAKRQTVDPGQPLHVAPDEAIGGFNIIGTSGVSGQMLFLGTDTKVYVVDKVENNPATVNGHPAWATEYDLLTNEFRAMDVVTNTFCAGGAVLGDGRWLNVGGNQAVDPLGVDSRNQDGNNVYQNADGAHSTRLLLPGEGSEWIDDESDNLTTRRWYPTLETLEDGRIIIIGGNQYGGFVNNEENNNPTFEFYPRAPGANPIGMNLLERTLPANLYPITHLIPTGQLLININLNSIMFDYNGNIEYDLPPVPKAVRTYPASAASFMVPMRVSDQWLATVYYCGGSDLQPNQWVSGLVLIDVPASSSCIKITPEVNNQFEDDDDLPEGRVMGNAILLPDGTVWVGNGANTGVAGYGTEPWTINDSYANAPIFSPLIFDPSKPTGQRWSRAGLKDSTVPRMYHSTATLLPDGSIFVTGSNPHPDVETDSAFPTEYRVERFYPTYYNKRRPEPRGVPTTIGYGGDYFELELSSDDLEGNVGNLKTIKIMLIKTGFSTHAINFGQRAAELDYTYTVHEDGSATLHVSQAPPNAAIMPPGPAWFFVTVNGVPSVGVHVMVGSGDVGPQEINDPEPLPASSEVEEEPDNGSSGDGDGKNGASSVAPVTFVSSLLAFVAASFTLFA